MPEQLIHGFREQELQALLISNKQRNECLKYLVPYRRCLYSSNLLSFLTGTADCDDTKRDFELCQAPIGMRQTGYGAMKMKYHDPKKFEQEKVAPSLEQNYRPNFMTVNIHQH